MAIVTITLTEQEQAALRQLIDAALRHAGTGALDVAAHFSAKLAAAAEDQGRLVAAGNVTPTAAEKEEK
jgi:hypothetical protein